MSNYQRNILLGLVVIVGLAVFTWLMLEFSGNMAHAVGPAQIAVQFDSGRADGVYEGTEIDYLGVQVGKVDRVTRNADNTSVTINGSVNKEPPLPANLHANIVTSLMGGGALINMELTSKAPTGQLAANARIPTQYVGVQLNVIPPSLADASSKIGEVSEELTLTLRQLRQSGSIEDLDKTIKTVAVQAQKIGKVFDSLESVVGNESSQRDLRLTIEGLRSTTDKLNQLADSLQTASVSATDTIKSTQRDVDAISKQVGDRLMEISRILMTTQEVVRKINDGKGTAGELVNDPKLYQSLVDTTQELNKTVSNLDLLVEQWEQEGLYLKLSK